MEHDFHACATPNGELRRAHRLPHLGRERMAESSGGEAPQRLPHGQRANPASRLAQKNEARESQGGYDLRGASPLDDQAEDLPEALEAGRVA